MTPPSEASNDRPLILFVCVKNAGKSQMAAALTRVHAGDRIDARSAGTRPGAEVNAESANAVAVVGGSFDDDSPKPLDPDVLGRADRVIVIGREAQVETADGMRADIETWHTDEPSERGITGAERMRLIRDDIDARCRRLVTEMLG